MYRTFNIKNNDANKNKDNYPRFLNFIKKCKEESFIIEDIDYPDLKRPRCKCTDIYSKEHFNDSIKNYNYENSYICIRIDGHYNLKYTNSYVPKVGDEVLYAVNSGVYCNKFLSTGIVSKVDNYKAKICENWVYHAKTYPLNKLENKELTLKDLNVGDKIITVVQNYFVISEVKKISKTCVITNYGTRVKNGEFYKLKEDV